MERYRFGKGEYRYFAEPFPDAVAGLKQALYPKLLPIARDWWAKLAREAELCFAILALSTDYDCWHPAEEAVTAASVIEVLRANIARAQDVVRALLPLCAATPRACGCGRAAEHAILTARDAIAPEARERLRILYGRYL